ncbi:MAG: hypothetical protein AAGF88_02550 [Pseudomonadota bacterium]
MSRYEFTVIPAPTRVRKLTDLTKGQDKFCATITDILTDMGLEGWDFMGAETLPYTRRRFIIFWQNAERTCLVFRREIERLVEPKRVSRPKAEVTEITSQPIREARSEVVAHFKTGARRIGVIEPDAAETKDTADEKPAVDMTGLSALERAVALDGQARLSS